MEKNIKIKLSGKNSLYGKFYGSFDKPLFIVVHGLLGNMDEDFYYSAVKWFKRHGFSTFRFNLYGYQKDARQLMDCTLKIQSADLDAVVRYFRAHGVKKIFIAGHSFGGLVILRSDNQNFDGAVLWDPAYKISFTKSSDKYFNGKYIKELDGYLMRWGVNFIIGKAMVKEIDSLDWNFIFRNLKVPFKIIIAGKGVLKNAKQYLIGAKSKTDLMVIKNATHYFNDEKGMRDNLFHASENWFKNYK